MMFVNNYPSYMKDMFTLRSVRYNLRGNYILSLPKPKTTTYGLHSFSYLSAKMWNSLSDDLRTCDQFYEFKRKIISLAKF